MLTSKFSAGKEVLAMVSPGIAAMVHMFMVSLDGKSTYNFYIA
jgi:hypothetical protein